MSTTDEFDVAIAGASIAGCTTAALLGRAGLRVALLEAHSDPDAYKVMCTHFIQASATPTIERLGLAGPLEEAGAIRNGLEIWTRYGWVRAELDGSFPYPTYGYSIRRQKLDPILRRIAAETPGVDLMLGHTVKDLIRREGRPAGVVAKTRDGTAREIGARLVVAADGRGSGVAKLAGVKARVKPHNRSGYFAYYEDLPLETGTDAQLWFTDPNVAYAFPNDDGTTLLAAFMAEDEVAAFKTDLKGNLERYFDGLPNAPDVRSGTMVSKVVGKLALPNTSRPAAAGGMAFVGDAAMSADPVWGVGCGWAFQAGEWLADEVAPALAGDGALDEALDRYRARHSKALRGHYFTTSDYSTGRRFSPVEKLLFSAAAKDRKTAERLFAMGSRSAPVTHALNPRSLARMLWVNATRRGSAESAEDRSTAAPVAA
jgi:flavin-dependent dehydrogenase